MGNCPAPHAHPAPGKMTKGTKHRWGALWTLGELKQLGRTPDSVLARRTGRTIKEVVAMRDSRRIALVSASRRWTAREIGMLGRFNDAELGRRLRRAHHDVWRQRRALHIPLFKPRPKWRAWARGPRHWTAKEDKRLGTVPDKVLATQLRVPALRGQLPASATGD